MVSDSTVDLSIILTSRNDDHGDRPLRRLQAMIDNLVFHAARLRPRWELVLVEWKTEQGLKPWIQRPEESCAGEGTGQGANRIELALAQIDQHGTGTHAGDGPADAEDYAPHGGAAIE